AGAPREEVVPAVEADGTLVVAGISHRAAVRALRSSRLLLGQEGRDAAERFLRAVLVVAVIPHEPLLHDRDLLPRFLVRPRRRRDEPEHVAALLEEVLLDRLAHPGVARELELLAGLERDHRLADDLLAERQLAGIGDLDLLLHRPQEALV